MPLRSLMLFVSLASGGGDTLRRRKPVSMRRRAPLVSSSTRAVAPTACPSDDWLKPRRHFPMPWRRQRTSKNRAPGWCCTIWQSSRPCPADLAEAEVLAERSLKILEKIYPPGRPRPFPSAAAAVVHSIRTAEDRKGPGGVSTIADGSHRRGRRIARCFTAWLPRCCITEGRYAEAETEYLASLAAWDEAGGGETADAVAVLNGLGTLYTDERRFPDATRTLDRAITIASSAKESCRWTASSSCIARVVARPPG